ncbi:Putative peptidoglycan binding domain-containing protein [Roseicitreum antarcticum]|uniref:Putative peptidoglycan binding domain-containing protein n=2 Tax=Roseicitreum antarcticum TaxID=564137 RepID=A0A1H2VLE4_9RHOB|nr:Putative peptidoglycan binding domain-containing protein [Roseicitreum antarcticum]
MFRAAGICVAVLIACLSPAAAQDAAFLQIEAHPTLRVAEERAQQYEVQQGNVVGFRLPSGWYALALGPFDGIDDANVVRQRLRAEGRIPSDAFATDTTGYRTQFWPVGADILTELRAQRTASDGLLTPPDLTTDTLPALPEVALDPAATSTQEAFPAPLAEPEPEPEPEPQETLPEARRSESLLSRDERAALQIALQWFDFYNAGIDAAFGPGTRNSMAEYQADRGFEATGVLTTRQRLQLIREYSDELAALGMELWRDETAGIEVQLPMAMVQFDRYEAPFAHFSERDDSGVRALLISQTGTQATLFGLYEIMQTLEIVPVNGARERQTNSFVLTGQNDTLRSHTFAQFRDGQIKGYTLIWTPERDEQMERVLAMVGDSFATFGGAMPDAAGQASAVVRRDLMSGLEVRRPEHSVSGFYIDAVGTVVTSLAGIEGCGRVTIDEAYTAQIVMRDAALGIAALRPLEPLVPMAFAQFLDTPPQIADEVAVAGFSFEDMLTRPVLTFGTLQDVIGLNGEQNLRRLSLEVMPGDSGGPVFDRRGAVVGMLLPRTDDTARVLPDDVNFAIAADDIRTALMQSDIDASAYRGGGAMTPAMLTRTAADMTVMVSCWN